MNVTESQRARHLIIRLDRGDELPGALERALDEASVRAGFFTAIGVLEAAEIALFDPHEKRYRPTRRIDSASEVVSMTGGVALFDGALSVRSSATLARETDAGLSLVGGQLLWARAFALEIFVTVTDDVHLARAADDKTGMPILASQAAPEVTPAPQKALHSPDAAPAMPVRPRAAEDSTVYPDEGDLVNHFHFGECVVISSEGDRIRLRQEKDGRVREVALAMLRVEVPTVREDGRKHFRLTRKN